LASKPSGLSYSALGQKIKFKTGGRFSQRLQELKESGFISIVPYFGKSTKERKYIVQDPYSLFYLAWIEPTSQAELQERDSNFWQKKRSTGTFNSWSGRAFESICLSHIEEIKRALGISGVSTTSSQWSYIPTPGSSDRGHGKDSPKRGAQIDLVIDRADGCIN